MMKRIFACMMLTVLLLGVLTLGAGAEQYPEYVVSVTDKDNLLTDADEQRVNEALLAATEADFEGYPDVLALCRRADKYGMDTPLSNRHAERGDLFEGLSIWEEEKYRVLQGTYPVISLSFARVKDKDYVITLEIEGKELNSVELSNKINDTMINNSDITFIIGGSYGLHEEIKKYA